MHLRSEVGDNAYKKHIMFADVGIHFRAAHTLGFWAEGQLEQRGVEETQWLSFPKAHGKGICDVQGGRLQHWLSEVSNAQLISKIASLEAILNRRVKFCETIGPGSARSIFYDSEPPDKKDWPQTSLDTRDLHTEGMAIRGHYFWSFVCFRGHPALVQSELITRPANLICRHGKLKPEKVHAQLGTLQNVCKVLKGLNFVLAHRGRSLPSPQCKIN